MMHNESENDDHMRQTFTALYHVTSAIDFR